MDGDELPEEEEDDLRGRVRVRRGLRCGALIIILDLCAFVIVMLINGDTEDRVYGTTGTENSSENSSENSYENSCSWREEKVFFYYCLWFFCVLAGIVT